MVRSITFKKTAATVLHAADQLRLRTVNSIQTPYLSSSIRGKGSNGDRSAYAVSSSGICRDKAPEAMIPFFRCSTPNPFRFFVSKCFSEFLTGSGFGKYPVVQFECEELAAEVTFKHQAFCPVRKESFRSEVIQQFVYIVKGTFGGEELTGRYIKKGTSTGKPFREWTAAKKLFSL